MLRFVAVMGRILDAPLPPRLNRVHRAALEATLRRARAELGERLDDDAGQPHYRRKDGALLDSSERGRVLRFRPREVQARLDKRPNEPAIKPGADAEANPRPSSTTPCEQCQGRHVRSVATPVRICYQCRRCHNSWNVPNRKHVPA